MEIYLVGGAVRDELLKRPIKERDWVVVGATPEEMLRLGYRQVGKDFPVFLHPETNEEYALARTERKIGRGYTGFEFDTSLHVTLEEDLLRRDLTMNAIAKKGEDFYDPYHGREDINNKLLRHVSKAFVEDPVRILRVARFAARFSELGFVVAPETNELMKQMVESGEVDALVPERIWKEWERALTENHPEEFFNVLDQCGALHKLFPEIKRSGKGMQALQHAAKVTRDPIIRFAVLLHDLTEAEIKEVSKRFRVPTEYQELALLTAKYVDQYNHMDQHTSIVKMFRELDAFRREPRAQKFALACRVITQNERAFDHFNAYLAAAKSVDAEQFVGEFKGKEIQEQLDLAREREIEKIRQNRDDKS